jgi:3'(2'),5'-bisphosphate nucleotidase
MSIQLNDACSLECAKLVEIISKAGKILTKLYKESLDIKTKSDGSPVTNADIAISNYLIEQFKIYFPDYGIVSEEVSDDGSRLTTKRLLIIDPIDGTKDFIAHDDEFCICVGCIENQKVIFCATNVVMKNEIYFASINKGAYCFNESTNKLTKIHTSTNTVPNIRVAHSHFHVSDEEKEFHKINSITSLRAIGSAYKMCLVAKGEIDLALKIGGHCNQWDIASVDLLLSEAGGKLLQTDTKQPFIYNTPDLAVTSGYIAINNLNTLKLLKFNDK